MKLIPMPAVHNSRDISTQWTLPLLISGQSSHSWALGHEHWPLCAYGADVRMKDAIFTSLIQWRHRQHTVGYRSPDWATPLGHSYCQEECTTYRCWQRIRPVQVKAEDFVVSLSSIYEQWYNTIVSCLGILAVKMIVLKKESHCNNKMSWEDICFKMWLKTKVWFFVYFNTFLFYIFPKCVGLNTSDFPTTPAEPEVHSSYWRYKLLKRITDSFIF